jgi:predicted component of type VI protein secretion system
MPYSQGEVAEQIGQLNDLMKQREKSMQLVTVHQKSAKHATYLKELDRADDNIAIAQEVLGRMLTKNVKGKK